MNTNNINQTPINENQVPYYQAVNTWFVNFDWFDLTSCGLLYVKEYDYDNLWEIEIEATPYPFQDGWIVLSYFTRFKRCRFTLVIRAENQTELNNTIDKIKRNIVKKEKNLDILINWQYRRTLASCESINFNREIWTSILSNVDIEFVTYNPHFYLIDPVSELSDEQTTWNYNIDIQNNWTAESDYVVYIVFGVGNTGINEITLIKDWFVLGIEQSISNWDVLIIDWERKDVFYNWNPIDYSWVFLSLELWSNPMQINMNGTAHNYVVTTKFLQKYR